MVNKHGESQCETRRGFRQMPRHLLPFLLYNLHCSLINPASSMSLAVTANAWRHKSLLATAWERASLSLFVSCSCMKIHGQCREQCKGQRLFGAAVFSPLQLTLAQPAIPLQACVSDFWVSKTTFLISGCQKPPWNGSLLTGVKRVVRLPMYLCYDVGITVPAWSMGVFVPVNTWLQIPVNLRGGICLYIWMTAGRTLDISGVGSAGPFSATAMIQTGISLGVHPID